MGEMFRNLSFYGEEFLAPRPTPKLEVHPLSAVRDCFFNVFAATLHIRRPFLHPQPEDAPSRGDRDRLIVVTGRHLSWWQGLTYRGDRETLIMVTGTDLSWWQGPTYRGDCDRLIVVTGTDLSWSQGPTYRGHRDLLIMVTVTDLSWWQGDTYHGDRDPLIMVTVTHLSWASVRHSCKSTSSDLWISWRWKYCCDFAYYEATQFLKVTNISTAHTASIIMVEADSSRFLSAQIRFRVSKAEASHIIVVSVMTPSSLVYCLLAESRKNHIASIFTAETWISVLLLQAVYQTARCCDL
jgi:hypothetical protein